MQIVTSGGRARVRELAPRGGKRERIAVGCQLRRWRIVQGRHREVEREQLPPRQHAALHAAERLESCQNRPTKKLWERLSPTGSHVLDSPLPTSRIPSRYLRPVFPRRSSFRDGRPEPPADVRSASTAASPELSTSPPSVTTYTLVPEPLVSLVASMRAAYVRARRPRKVVLRTQTPPSLPETARVPLHGHLFTRWSATPPACRRGPSLVGPTARR